MIFSGYRGSCASSLCLGSWISVGGVVCSGPFSDERFASIKMTSVSPWVTIGRWRCAACDYKITQMIRPCPADELPEAPQAVSAP